MTKELLAARQSELEGRMEDQRNIQARGASDIERIQRRVIRARDEENALGGAIQDCKYWLSELSQLEARHPAPGEVVEVIVTK